MILDGSFNGPVVSWLDMLPREIDAVVYAGLPQRAAHACKTALALGLPVLCEKPAGLSLVDAETIAAAQRAAGGLVLVGHQHLFAEGYETIRDMGPPDSAVAFFTGTTAHDFPPMWDYGAHAVACLIGLGCLGRNWKAGVDDQRRAFVTAWHKGVSFTYDGYAPAEPPLTRQVRAFARAVRAGGTDDWRFGARWAVDVARALEAAATGTLAKLSS